MPGCGLVLPTKASCPHYSSGHTFLCVPPTVIVAETPKNITHEHKSNCGADKFFHYFLPMKYSVPPEAGYPETFTRSFKVASKARHPPFQFTSGAGQQCLSLNRFDPDIPYHCHNRDPNLIGVFFILIDCANYLVDRHRHAGLHRQPVLQQLSQRTSLFLSSGISSISTFSIRMTCDTPHINATLELGSIFCHCSPLQQRHDLFHLLSHCGLVYLLQVCCICCDKHQLQYR